MVADSENDDCGKELFFVIQKMRRGSFRVFMLQMAWRCRCGCGGDAEVSESDADLAPARRVA